MGRESQGLSLIELLTAVAIILIIAAIAVPCFLGLLVAAREASAVSSLHALNAAEATYSSTFGGSFSTDMASLGPPQPGANVTSTAAGLIDGVLAQGAKSGYLFSYSPGAVDSTGRVTAYVFNAAPAGKWTGNHQYYSDQSGVVTSASAPSAENTPTACSESGDTVTVTSTLNPPVGSVIYWSGATPPTYNSSVNGWTVTDSSSSSFSFQNPTSGLGACTVMGSVSLIQP